MISICIPSRRSNAQLKATILSISSLFDQLDPLVECEICVSLNSPNKSERNEQEIQQFVQKCLTKKVDFKIVTTDGTLAIDNNMHLCFSLATRKYCYFLGDDDKVNVQALSEVINYMYVNKEVLLAVSGINSTHFNYEIHEIHQEAQNVRMHSKFGNIIFLRELHSCELFKKFYGTSHAYAAFWLSLFELRPSVAKNLLICNDPFAYSRRVPRAYSISTVMYEDIFNDIDIYLNSTVQGSWGHELTKWTLDKHLDMIFSSRFIFSSIASGYDANLIRKISRKYARNSRYIVMLTFVPKWFVSILSNVNKFYKFLVY